MPAYLIAEHIVTDDAKFLEYVTKARPLMAKHGGRYLTKNSSHQMPEGGHWKPDRVLIIEFPDMDALDALLTLRIERHCRNKQNRNDPQQPVSPRDPPGTQRGHSRTGFVVCVRGAHREPMQGRDRSSKTQFPYHHFS